MVPLAVGRNHRTDVHPADGGLRSNLVLDQGWPADRYATHLTRLLERALLTPDP